jgi:hypothetical protein
MRDYLVFFVNYEAEESSQKRLQFVWCGYRLAFVHYEAEESSQKRLQLV